MFSVVIPAHNEEAAIARTLEAIVARSPLGPAEQQMIEIIVVCNGCTDRTAEVARSFGSAVTVIETSVASKVHALNVGDRAAGDVFPRFFVDADVIVERATLERLADVLEREAGVLAAAPRFRMDLAGCGWAVRAFWRITDLLPSAREGIGGSGVYGLSRAGRARFGEFPSVTADDAFVRIQFDPHERRTVRDAFSTVYSPRRLGGLVDITTRAHFGNAELQQRYPERFALLGERNHRSLFRLWKYVGLWPELAVYVGVKVVARLRVRRKLRAGSHIVAWERDATSRTPISPDARTAAGALR